MQALFDTGPSYDPHIKSIIKLMLSHLRNNKPKEDSKVYVRNASYLQELYDGKFLHHAFSTGRTDYDYQGSFDKIKSCKGSWQNIRNCILTSLDNLELAKQNDYLPYNKNFLETISFATFFKQQDMVSKEWNCNFLNFQNPPKKKIANVYRNKINKIRENIINLILSEADKIASKYFQDESDEFQFWNAIDDFNRWIKLMKNTFPSIYGEFILGCKNGNPLTDFNEFIENYLKKKQGSNFIVMPYYFRLTIPNQNKLGGSFLDWLIDGISNNKFSSFKNLSKPIMNYYYDNDFINEVVIPKKKSVVDIETVIF